MWPFKKKQKKEEDEEDKEEDLNPDTAGKEEKEEEKEEKEPEPAPQPEGGGNLNVTVAKMSADVDKLKAQFSTFYELQKASGERFSRIGEQLGELRSMMIERDKDSQRLEAKATQAVDLVKAVQPDKFMVDLRRTDSKTEALKANLESMENILKNTINELKALRDKMSVFSGMEQVIKMNEEVKNELMGIRKVQTTVERHADKVDTIFSEVQKKTKDFVRFNDTVQDLDKSFKQVSSEFDSIKVKITDFATKKEVENLIAKFDDFEKYVGSIVTLLNNKFEKLDKTLTDEFNQKFAETDQLLKGFQELAMKTPDLDKYFHLLKDSAKPKEQPKQQVEKLKTPGVEEPPKVEKKESVVEKVGEAVAGVKDKVVEKIKK